eukprot:GFYU01006420.1.p1 GENE.GFYU01006420.1~~GFYU01006420.1.p1  ORF type:complete len:698 (-),score=217.27 GFYU01006420.1:165-2198(-)
MKQTKQLYDDRGHGSESDGSVVSDGSWSSGDSMELEGKNRDIYDGVEISNNSLDYLKGKTQPLHLEWSDLHYTVKVGKEDKVILDNVSGVVEPGRLLAVMGPTGSGKTSLLNVLAARVPAVGALSGQILANGKPRTSAYRYQTSYVMQDDSLFSMLTVRETMQLAARLRLPKHMTTQEKEEFVSKIIVGLGLKKAENTRIGGGSGGVVVRGISGGERRRVMVGIEMISDPSVLFLDEPTSGLDSFQAQNVMTMLGGVAKAGRSVVTTIHQPRSSIFAMFDLLCLLSEGKLLYFGPAKDAVKYFERMDYPCPEHFNPADYFLDIISKDNRSEDREKSSEQRIEMFAEEFKIHQAQMMRKSSTEGDVEMGEGIVDDTYTSCFGSMESQYPISPVEQLYLLFGRTAKQAARDIPTVIFSIVNNIVFGLLLGALYFDMGYEQRNIQDRVGILFFMVINSAFGGMFLSINTFPIERQIVTRERASKSYHASTYFISKALTEIPLRLMSGPLILSCIVYWMTGLEPDGDRFGRFLAIVMLDFWCSIGLGILIGSMVPSVELASALGPVLMIIFLLFGGFYINKDSIPIGAQWVAELSFIKYAFEALMVNEMTGVTFTCADNTKNCVATGEEVLKNFGLEDVELWQSFTGLVVFVVAIHILGYIAFRFNTPKFAELEAIDKKSK